MEKSSLRDWVPSELLKPNQGHVKPVTMPQCATCGSFAMYKLPDGGLACLTCFGKWEEAERAKRRAESELIFENFVRETRRLKPKTAVSRERQEKKA